MLTVVGLLMFVGGEIVVFEGSAMFEFYKWLGGFCILCVFFFGYFDGRLLVLMILFGALYKWCPLYLMSLLSEEVMCYVLILAD